MNDTPSEKIDELFVQIRLRLLKIRESDPTTAAEMKSLLTQLEWPGELQKDLLQNNGPTSCAVPSLYRYLPSLLLAKKLCRVV